jgi:hypothetical protein
VRAKIAGGFGKYPWSSYWAYLAKTDTLGLINTDQVLRMFSENEARARRHYEAFMNDGATVKRGDIYATIDQRVLGDERFVEGVVKKHGGDVKKERGKKEYTLPQVVHALERQYRVSLEEMRSWGRTKEILTVRRLFSIIAKEYGYTGREIAAYLQKDPAAVTGYLRRSEDFRREVDIVITDLRKD